MSNQPPVLGPDGVARPYIGGQALIEGVMMRSPHAYAAVLRRHDGSLTLREAPMPDHRVGWRALPLARGVVTLVESLRLGSRALRYSAEVYERDLAAAEERGRVQPPSALAALSLPIVALLTQEPGGPPPSGPRANSGGGLFPWLGVALALALFVALPQAFAAGIDRLFSLGLDVRDAGFQLLTGGAKIAIVVGYMLAIRRLPEIYRVFQYHGAEHKAIAAYESGAPLSVEAARGRSTLHPRCGTTFLVMVALISVGVFTALGPFLPQVGGGALLENVLFFLMKLPFLPLIAAVTFELQRLLARHAKGPLEALLWPGFLVQRITTIEPDERQLEVALAALGATLHRERNPEAAAPAEDRSYRSLDELLRAA